MRLIINADDLGYSEGVNAEIFDLASRNLLTSATLITNAPFFDRAIERLANFPRCSFGIHLNLTEFRPLTSSPGLQPLLNPSGEFDGDAIRSITLTPLIRHAIFQEWSAQVTRLIAAGHVPSHLDSHHHVHTIPPLLPILKRVQRRFVIRRVRITKNIYGPDQPVSKSLLLRKRVWNFLLRHWYSTATTQGFTSFREFYDLVAISGLGRWLRDDKSAVIELMTHPGNPLFQEETALLYSPWVGAGASTFQPASYSDL